MGGQTVFPRIQTQVEPVAGSAVVWENADEFGTVLGDSEHGGLPVLEGTKIAVNCWIRDRPYRAVE
jgi:prolyl 4-hydroxylase